MAKARNSRRSFVACLSVLACGLMVVCGSEPAPQANLILITVDTLRSDHLGAWGYSRRTSPSIDRLARSAAVFENAYSHSSWTLPSLASLLTSTYTSTHDCGKLDSQLRDRFETLAERLRAHGYSTAAIASHVFMSSRYGLQQGFQHYDQELIADGVNTHLQISSQSVTRKGMSWLESQRGANPPFFLWLHYFDPHSAYLEHPGISEAFGTEREIDLYDGEIAFTDLAIGQLLDYLDEVGLSADTIVALTSDHGEEFSEHGGSRHGKTLYGEVIRVPLLIRAPGIPPIRVRQNMPSVDVLPTLLELMELPAARNIAGRSAVALMRGEPGESRPIFGELHVKNRLRSESLLTGSWKLIRKIPGGSKLFDLTTDAAERHNLANAYPDIVKNLQAELEVLSMEARRAGAQYTGAKTVELSVDEIENLRQLGYVVE